MKKPTFSFLICVCCVCVCVRERAADGGGADNKIGDEGARAIGEGLQHCPVLQTLNLKSELTNFDLFLFWVVVMRSVLWRLVDVDWA